MTRILIAIFTLLPTVALAETATLTWTHPTQFTDGSALALVDIKVTTIRCSAVVIDGARGPCTIAPVSAPAPTATAQGNFEFDARGGQVCWQAQTVLINGLVSEWSNEVCKTIPAKKPNAPVLTISVSVSVSVK